jgi:hypothetical protein
MKSAFFQFQLAPQEAHQEITAALKASVDRLLADSSRTCDPFDREFAGTLCEQQVPSGGQDPVFQTGRLFGTRPAYPTALAFRHSLFTDHRGSSLHRSEL